MDIKQLIKPHSKKTQDPAGLSKDLKLIQQEAEQKGNLTGSVTAEPISRDPRIPN